MPRSGQYNQRYIRLVRTRPSHQEYIWTPGETYHGFHDGTSIHIHNFPDLAIGDRLQDKATNFIYKINALFASDNEWVCAVNLFGEASGGGS